MKARLIVYRARFSFENSYLNALLKKTARLCNTHKRYDKHHFGYEEKTIH